MQDRGATADLKDTPALITLDASVAQKLLSFHLRYGARRQYFILL